MTTVDIHEARTHLSRLIEAAVGGAPFIIADAGKPLVKVEAIPPASPVDVSRRFGFMHGEFKVSDDFDTLMQDEIIEMFEGDPGKFANFDAALRSPQDEPSRVEKP